MGSKIALFGLILLTIVLVGFFFAIPGSDEDTGETPSNLPPPAENQPSQPLTPGTDPDR